MGNRRKQVCSACRGIIPVCFRIWIVGKFPRISFQVTSVFKYTSQTIAYRRRYRYKVNILTEEKSQENPGRKWIPVLAVVIAVAIIGVYYVGVFLPGQVPVVAPENSADLTPQHTIQWKNDCSYPVWVDIMGGQQYAIPETIDRVGACGCYQIGHKTSNPLVCNPTTKCDNSRCTETNLCNQGKPLVDNGGFYLAPSGGTHTSAVDSFWQGAFWGRTGCKDNDGDFRCDVGTCVKAGSADKGQLECGGIAAHGPLTKGEFNFDEGGHDTYDVSLVDGFNVPMSIKPVAGTFKNDGTVNKDYDCTASAAETDLFPLIGSTKLSAAKLLYNASGKAVGMKSACYYADETNDPRADEYCCRGAYHESTSCKPDTWPADLRTATFFKQYNPKAYSFAYNDASSTYQCKNKSATILTSYDVTFCPAKVKEGTSAPGSADTTLIPVNTPVQVVTHVPTMTAAPVQSAVPNAPYNPASSGNANF